MKIAIADDHTLFLEGISLLLSTFPFVEETGMACNYGQLDALLSETAYDILLLDIHFGKHDGRQIAPEIKRLHPHLKIIALTSHGDPATIKMAVAAGFDGYLLKIDGRQEIEKALNAVTHGEPYFSSKTQQVVFESQITGKTPELTDREQEVLELIVAEKTTKEIAETLHLSEKTVETHRGNIMIKLETRNIAGMVRKAILHGLVRI